MPYYANFMKELVAKQRRLDFDTIEVSHNYNAIMENKQIKNRDDPEALLIPCTIVMPQFSKAL